MDLDKFENKNIHVIGLSGAEGSAVASFLVSNIAKAQITAHDFCDKNKFRESFNSFHDGYSEDEKEKLFAEISSPAIKINFNESYLDGIESAEIIFVPQSWFRYQENKKLHDLRSSAAFYNITKLYFQLCPCPIIAVTGTSGKSTTTSLIHEILKEGGKKVWFTGNDRQNIQVLPDLDQIAKSDLMVMEVSNRQLKIDLEKSPKIGVITNITPNHLDDHKDFTEYVATKRSLLKYQLDSDFVVLNGDDEATLGFVGQMSSQAYLFSRKSKPSKGCYLHDEQIVLSDGDSEQIICSIKDILLPGPHNLENVMAAVMAAYLAGANTKDIRKAVTSYQGLSSRLELVSEVEGVKYYEDSAACNPDGTRMAVKSFTHPMVLIAGGSRQKKLPEEYNALARDIVRSKIKAVLLIGEEADDIEKSIRDVIEVTGEQKMLIKKCTTLGGAVDNASIIAKSGDVVVLSPGCESFGMFEDYRDRGRQYKKLVDEL